MKKLTKVEPTPEQLKLIMDFAPGFMIIRGAAGSGKTTTALLRLLQLAGSWLNRRKRAHSSAPVRTLVLTFNRTLRGYIAGIAEDQLGGKVGLQLEVSTFAKWAHEGLGRPSIVDDDDRTAKLKTLARKLDTTASVSFIVEEAEYAMGRFGPADMDGYIDVKREGRGSSPKWGKELRRELLGEVIKPYRDWLSATKKCDWHDVAVQASQRNLFAPYDIIIADETQDFSANEMRAVLRHAADPSSVTFILDAAQRIYPRSFTWKEVGLSITSAQSFHLKNNYRNTVEIARLAHSLLDGIEVGDDGTLPDFDAASRHGSKPILLKGTYSEQVAYAIQFIRDSVDLGSESVAFCKPLGGGWFNFLSNRLTSEKLPHVTLTRKADWPEGTENIALCTMKSVKGLEFDHVICLGLNAEVTDHGSDEGDSQLEALRRLLAMTVGRARSSVILGYKPAEASELIKYIGKTAVYRVVL